MTPTIIPKDDKGNLILEECTLDQFESVIFLFRLGLYDTRCSFVEDIEDELNDISWQCDELVSVRKARLKHLDDMLKNPRCKDPSAILHAKEIQIAEVKAHREAVKAKRLQLEKELEEERYRVELYEAMIRHGIEKIRIFVANKYHVDIMKGYPSPPAYHDPLYHDVVNRYVADASKLKWDDGWEDGKSEYHEDPPNGEDGCI